MATTPVDIQVQTDPDGSVLVSIQIAGSSSVATGLLTAQLEGGEYGIDGLVDSWVTSQPVAPGVYQEVWYVKDSELDGWKSGNPAWNTNYLGAFVPQLPDEFLNNKGVNPADYDVINQVAAYQPINRTNDLPVPMPSGSINTNFRSKVFNSDPIAGWVHVGFLFRSCSAIGPSWEDTWAFMPGFSLGNSTVQVKVEQDLSQPGNPLTWRNTIAPQCIGGSFLKMLYPKP